MAQTVGILKFKLRSGSSQKDFEKLMAEQVFPEAAESCGVDRGGRSAIKSQHLLKSAGVEDEYIWFIKHSGALDLHWPKIFEGLVDDTRPKLESFAVLDSATMFVLVAGFDAGPRDTSGRTTGNPVIGVAI